MWWKWWLPYTVFFMKPVKYSHFFESLIYPFVQVEIKNINPHYVGCYTYTQTQTYTQILCYVQVYWARFSGDTPKYTLYWKLFSFMCSTPAFSRDLKLIYWIIYLWDQQQYDVVVVAAVRQKKTSMMRAKNLVRTSHLLALAWACVFFPLLLFYLFDK